MFKVYHTEGMAASPESMGELAATFSHNKAPKVEKDSK